MARISAATSRPTGLTAGSQRTCRENASSVRDEADHPPRGLQRGRDLHQRRGAFLFAHAARRVAVSSLHRGRLFLSICAGSGVALGLPPPRQRRSVGGRRRFGDGAIGRLLRILAAGQSRLGHPPSRTPRRRRPLDRIGGPVQRAEFGLVHQLTGTGVVARQMFRGHDLFNNLSRRHGLCRITQDIADSLTTFARAKPVNIATSPLRLVALDLKVRLRRFGHGTAPEIESRSGGSLKFAASTRLNLPVGPARGRGRRFRRIERGRPR